MKILPPALLRLCVVLIGVVAALATLTVPAEAATTVQISGTVTNSDGVNQNGYFYVQRVGANSASGVGVSDGQFNWNWDTTQNPEGDFVMYVRSTTMDDVQRYFVAGDLAGTTVAANATQFHLGPDSPPLNLSMVMPAIATVSGKVVDADGQGVAGRPVTLYENGPNRQTTTGPGGTYSFGYTQPGTWTVTAHGGTDYLSTQRSVTVPASGAVVVPDMVLHRTGSIEGQVTDSVTGAPVPFVQVQAYDPNTHAYIGDAVGTDVSGHYRISRLSTAPFVLRFVDPLNNYAMALNNGGDPNDWTPNTPIVLAEGESRTLDQQLVLNPAPQPPAHTLSGTVTDSDGRPVPYIQVAAGDVTASTDRRGHWFLNAPDGTHTLRFSQDWHWTQLFAGTPGWAQEYFPNVYAEAAATSVTVAGGVGADDLDVTVGRAGRITGNVVTSGDPTADTHEIWVYDESGALISASGERGGTAYSVDVPADLPVRLVARGTATDDPVLTYLPRWFGDVDTLVAATPIQVAAGATATGKDFHLADTALTPVTAPSVSGLASVGSTLTASTGTWSVQTLTDFTTTWLRDGVPVGTGRTYVVKAADAGRSIRARVTATNGHATAQALSAPKAISRLTTAVAARATSPRSRTVKLIVTVTARGLTPQGTLVIRRGSTVVNRGARLVNGKAVVVLKRQPSGSVRYTVSYGGSTQTLPSKAVVKVRVR